MPRHALGLLCLSAAVALSACQCGGETLVKTFEGGNRPPDAGAGGGGGGSGVGGGVAAGGGGGGGAETGGGAGGGTAGPDWCASDCDCPSGQRCISNGGELVSNTCQPGTSTCVTPCAAACPSGTQCVEGVCTVTPCVGTNCVSSLPISVQGRYFTYYELDIHEFADRASDMAKLLDLLSAALSGNANCGAQTTPEGRLMCIVVSLAAQNVRAPPWVQQLLTVLSGTMRFGDKPIKAKGVMQLAENANARLYAAETWSEMWLEFNGQTLNVMNSPTLGTNGQIAVTVRAFGGSRTATEVVLGPRQIEFDVNKLLVNLINVAIIAASNNQARDVGELLELILCDQIPPTDPNYAVCLAAASSFANNFELNSGLGGISITQQRAAIFDLDNNGVADALGLPTAKGSVAGSMSNGLVSGALGPFPKSWWYGTK